MPCRGSPPACPRVCCPIAASPAHAGWSHRHTRMRIERRIPPCPHTCMGPALASLPPPPPPLAPHADPGPTRGIPRHGRRHCRAALRRRWHPVLACHSKASLRAGEDDEPEEVSAHCSRRTCRTCLAPRTPRTPSAGWGRRERTGVPGRSCPPEHRSGSKSALLLRHMSFIRFFMLSYSAVTMLRCIASGNSNRRSRQRTY
jgi:hypothetical protein